MEDAGAGVLTDDFGEGEAGDAEAVVAKGGGVEGGADGLPDGRKLGGVTKQQQGTAFAGADVTDEVVEKAAAAETAGDAVVGYHGGFVDDEEGLFVKVTVEGEGGLVEDGFLAVDFLVDGVGGGTGVEGEDFGGTACGGKKDDTATEGAHGTDGGTDDRGLAGAGVSAEDEGSVGSGTENEGGQQGDGPTLPRCRGESALPHDGGDELFRQVSIHD